MNLVRFGQTTVNMDRVTCIRDLSTRDGSGQVTQGLMRLEFSGGEPVEVAQHSAQLRTWLLNQATDLTPLVP
jgi:hypothetical protein